MEKIRISILFLLIFFCLPIIYAQTAVPPVQPVSPNAVQTCNEFNLITKYQQEEQNTRKFIVDTFNTKTQEFFQQADNRIAYLEAEYQKQLQRVTITFGALWFCVTLLVVSIYSFLSIKLQKRRYKQLKQTTKDEITKEILAEISKRIRSDQNFLRPSIDLPQEPIKAVEMAQERINLHPTIQIIPIVEDKKPEPQKEQPKSEQKKKIRFPFIRMRKKEKEADAPSQ
jgi:hypothetical protein